MWFCFHSLFSVTGTPIRNMLEPLTSSSFSLKFPLYFLPSLLSETFFWVISPLLYNILLISSLISSPLLFLSIMFQWLYFLYPWFPMCISLFWIKNSFFCLFYGLLLLCLSFWESWTYIQILKPVSDCFIICFFLWHEFFQLLHLLLDFQGILFNVCWKYFMSNFEDFSFIPSCLVVLKMPLPSS